LRHQFRAYLSACILLLCVFGVVVPSRVAAATTYSLDVTPTTATQTQGGTSSFTIHVENVTGNPEVILNSTVGPFVSGSTGFQTQIGPTDETTPYTATLIITSSATTPPNMYLFIVSAKSTSGEVHQLALTVNVTAGSFTITPTPTIRQISRGDSAEFDLTVASTGGFSRIVYLSSELPTVSGLTASIAPTQNIPSPSFTAKLRVYSANSTSPGTYVVDVDGATTSGGTPVYSAGVTVIIGGAANFTVSIDPATKTGYRGQTVNYTVTVAAAGSFYQPVSLSATTSSGLTATVSPASNTPPFDATLLVNIASTASVATYSITVSGTSSGGAVYQAATSLTVSATDFTVTMGPDQQATMRGGTASFQVNVTTTSFHSTPVDLSVTNLPTGIQAVLSKTHAVANFTAQLLVSVGVSASPGLQVIVVQGSSAGITSYATAALFVMLPDFAVNVSPLTASIDQGGSAMFTVNVTRLDGMYISQVSLSAAPPTGKGITVTFSPSSGYLNMSSTMMVSTSTTTPTGGYVIPITAAGTDGVSHQTVISIMVGPSTFSVSISSSSSVVSLYQGQQVHLAVLVNKTGIFSGSVTLTASEPSGVLAPAVGPTSGTPPFTATLVVTTDLSTTVGEYVVTVSGSAGGQTQSAGIVLSVKQADFTVSISPAATSIYQTQSGTFTLTVAGNPFFPGTVVFQTPTISPTSTNMTATVSPVSGLVGSGSFSSTLFVSTGANTGAGTYSISVQAWTGTGTVVGTWTHSVSVTLSVITKPADYYVRVRTSGMTSEGYTTVYIDGSDQDMELNDAMNVTEVGPFDGLSSHTISVESSVELDTVKFTCASSSFSVSAATKLTFKYQEWYLTTWKTDGLPTGRTVTISVGGSSYSDSSPADIEVWVKTDKTLSFSLVAPHTIQDQGKMYTFVKWVNSAGSTVTSPITITGADTFTAKYTRSMFDVTVHDIQGANITLGSSSLTVSAEGAVIFTVKPGTYTLSTTQSIGGGTVSGTVFKYWIIPTGSNNTDPANPTTVSVSTDIDITIYRTEQVKLILVSERGAVKGAGWYDIGTTAQFSVDASMPIDAGSRYYCAGYTGDVSGAGNSGSVVMSGSKTVTFQWKKQFLLTLVSQYGTKSGDGWYDVGATAQFSITPGQDPGVHYMFVSWTGDFAGASSSGTVTMDGPKTVTASWKRQLLTQLSFIDGDGQPLAASPSKVVLTGPAGESTLESLSGVYLEEGDWSIVQVIYDGVDVSSGGSYTASLPSGRWEIPLRVYSLTVTVKSLLLHSSIVDSTVSVPLPDGTFASAPMNGNGTAILAQLPAGTYQVQATGGIFPMPTTVELDHTHDLSVNVLGATDVGAIAALVAILIVSAVLYVKWKKKKRLGAAKSSGEEEGSETSEGAEEELPVPPPPPDEEKGSLRDFFEHSKSGA